MSISDAYLYTQECAAIVQRAASWTPLDINPGASSREEWEKLLRTARKLRVLHMPIE
jgi:hypothetical protein